VRGLLGEYRTSAAERRTVSPEIALAVRNGATPLDEVLAEVKADQTALAIDRDTNANKIGRQHLRKRVTRPTLIGTRRRDRPNERER
jgi:hypothetical protein